MNEYPNTETSNVNKKFNEYLQWKVEYGFKCKSSKKKKIDSQRKNINKNPIITEMGIGGPWPAIDLDFFFFFFFFLMFWIFNVF